MIAELGHFSLMVALAVALVQGTLPVVGAARGNAAWMDLARPAARAVFVLVLVAAACLVASFLRDDFSVVYVATNSTRALPVRYKIAAFWGGHEGSMLLWLLILSFWMFAVSLFSRHLPQAMVARILGVMGLIAVGFLLFILLTSSPFERLIPAAEEGRDLNPLLQDPGMVAHPPMLYMGYVGFSVAFAFAIAALLGGNLDATWARWSRPWTTVAWSFLTLGICLGSAWAYYTLGWGGWWFWDPVENASFMPWLAGTALMHSLAVTEKRGAFKVWTVLLAIFAFSLSLLGTFLVRSGVLTSVHAFANDPRRGVFILLFLSVVIGGSLALYAWRAPKVGLGERFELVSRETMLLTNNVLLLAAAGAVLLGTLWPLLVDALGLAKQSVGPPYFNVVFVPLMTPALFLMGIGPLARWKQANLPEIGTRLKWAFGVSLITALLLPLALGKWSGLAAFGLWLALWIFGASLVNLWSRVRPLSGDGVVARLRSLPRGYLGMLAAHVGVAVFITGVTLVKTYESEKDVQIDVGDTVTMGPYTFVFKGVESGGKENYLYGRGTFEVSRNGGPSWLMHPEKRQFMSQRGEPSTVAAIDRGFTRDLYLALGEQVANNSTAWIVRVYYKPFVDWVWGGCLLMAIGGALALSDRRYRFARSADRETLGSTLSAAPAWRPAYVKDLPSPACGRGAGGEGFGSLIVVRYLIPLAAFLVLTGFLMKGLWLDPHQVPSPLIDKPAPQFRLTQVADPAKTLSRDEMLGKVWLLNVWASWCVSCREEHPVLVEFSKTGLVPIYGLDYKDTRDEALKWLGQLGNPYQASLFDQDGRVGIDYGVYGVPETYVIDKTGTIRYKQIGPITPEILHDTIVPLVKRLNA